MADISKRMVEVLGSVSFVLAEDTRITAGLMNAISAKAKLISYHKFNEKSRTQNIIDKILNGESAALVSDAGTPLISDPGHIIVDECAKMGIEVISVPGPSSVTAALSVSGFDCSRFIFMGFVPKKEKEAEENIKFAGKFEIVSVWFEAPGRIEKTLSLVDKIYPDRRLCVIKEITKVHERVFRGAASSVLKELTPDKQKGEFVIVIDGGYSENAEIKDDVIIEKLNEYILSGDSRSSAIKKTADFFNCSKNRVYKLAHTAQQEEKINGTYEA